MGFSSEGFLCNRRRPEEGEGPQLRPPRMAKFVTNAGICAAIDAMFTQKRGSIGSLVLPGLH
jgi:hypothetical protein